MQMSEINVRHSIVQEEYMNMNPLRHEALNINTIYSMSLQTTPENLRFSGELTGLPTFIKP